MTRFYQSSAAMTKARAECVRLLAECKTLKDPAAIKQKMARVDRILNKMTGKTKTQRIATALLKKQAEAQKGLADQDRVPDEAEIAHWQQTLRVEDPYLDGLQVFWCKAKEAVAVVENGGAQGQYEGHLTAYRRELETRNAYLKLLREIAHAMQFKPHKAKPRRLTKHDQA
jgi:hypothetical protein